MFQLSFKYATLYFCYLGKFRCTWTGDISAVLEEVTVKAVKRMLKFALDRGMMFLPLLSYFSCVSSSRGLTTVLCILISKDKAL